jgi:hypothetical protein
MLVKRCRPLGKNTNIRNLRAIPFDRPTFNQLVPILRYKDEILHAKSANNTLYTSINSNEHYSLCCCVFFAASTATPLLRLVVQRVVAALALWAGSSIAGGISHLEYESHVEKRQASVGRSLRAGQSSGLPIADNSSRFVASDCHSRAVIRTNHFDECELYTVRVLRLGSLLVGEQSKANDYCPSAIHTLLRHNRVTHHR